jgi:hypothetical protein
VTRRVKEPKKEIDKLRTWSKNPDIISYLENKELHNTNNILDIQNEFLRIIREDIIPNIINKRINIHSHRRGIRDLLRHQFSSFQNLAILL